MSKPIATHTLSEEDIEQIVSQVTEQNKEILDKVKSNQRESYEQETKLLEQL